MPVVWGVRLHCREESCVLVTLPCNSCFHIYFAKVGEHMHSKEVARGERFKFGKNWSLFLSSLDEKRIRAAEQSLSDMLELPDLKGKRFLDIDSGSGLFSLAARRLGATVHSFDYDPDSVPVQVN